MERTTIEEKYDMMEKYSKLFKRFYSKLSIQQKNALIFLSLIHI